MSKGSLQSTTRAKLGTAGDSKAKQAIIHNNTHTKIATLKQHIDLRALAFHPPRDRSPDLTELPDYMYILTCSTLKEVTNVF